MTFNKYPSNSIQVALYNEKDSQHKIFITFSTEEYGSMAYMAAPPKLLAILFNK